MTSKITRLSVELEERLVEVPIDSTAEEIVAGARAACSKAKLEIDGFDECLENIVRADLELVKGRKLRALAQKIGEECVHADVWSWQERMSIDGNAAAFMLWVIEAGLPQGMYNTFANSRERFFRDQDEYLYTPGFHRKQSICTFSLCDVSMEYWFGDERIVAFQPVT